MAIRFIINKKEEVFTIEIDDSYCQEYDKYKWYVSKAKSKRYVKRQSRTKPRYGIWLHREVFNTRKLLDHIDGNGLNNRKENLRIASPKENSRNKLKTHGISKYKGVIFKKDRKRNKPWFAKIKIGKNQKSLGCYETEIEAAIEYDKAALKYFKQFAKINFPKD